ncbi:succinate-semialdehyde dehydrogenase [Rhodotorula diobovata]|uniref:aldehyde dehydrogenase (NAD(+)) n=1 Tax=Rhodotorula diobovata TaxID=5288 RepID=A0A5C5G630_9BASI|nr:succinate-semialdehyde dehydrogenase [Rhodotorula diobovata]
MLRLPRTTTRAGGVHARALSTRAQSVFSSLQLPTSGEPIPGVYYSAEAGWCGSGPLQTSRNPATGETLAEVRTASRDDVDKALKATRLAYEMWRNVAAPKRGEVLRQMRGALNERIDDLGALVTLEMGKVASEGRGEVQEFVDVMDFAVGLSRTFGGTVVQSEREKHFITEVANPLGTIGIISAFNFPTAVFGWNFSLAMVTGNASVWKPAPTTPLTAVATTKILQSVLEANKLPGALAALVCGGGETGDALVSDKRVDLLSFTGSEARGREVSMKVAGRFGQSLLELGGNNAAIVLPDANLPLALQAITFAALGTAGQRCTSTRRVFLQESIAPHFISSLVEAYKSITPARMGDPLASGTLVGPLHSQDAVKRFEDAVNKAKEQGGEVLIGGNVVKMDGELAGGNWVEPTIVLVRDVDKVAIMKQETFAPILYVSTFDTLEEAIQLNNAVEQGLSTSLFTKDLGAAMQVIGPAGADSGIINVNSSTSGAEIGARFGGNKSTGWGRESGGDAWKQYVRWSSCTLNWSDQLGLAQGVKFE